MRFLPPLVLHGAHRASEAELEAHGAMFASRLQQYPAWPEIDAIEPCEVRDVAPQDRPG
jgi:glutathione-regulated potassium-efflux system ancillary protein KefF